MAKAQKAFHNKTSKQHKFQIINLPIKMQVEDNYGLINPLDSKSMWLYQIALK